LLQLEGTAGVSIFATWTIKDGANMQDATNQEVMTKLHEIETLVKKLDGKLEQVARDIQSILTLVMSQSL
jgi:uncharacterized lipoprotein YmbA